MEHSSSTFAAFADKIRELSANGPTEEELSAFLLKEDGKRIRVYYAPFDWVNTSAAVAIVGITPGKDSMMNAFRAAAAALRNGESVDEALKRGKQSGIFSNMRNTIAQMLDELGLPGILRIHSTIDLFGPRLDLLHPTSCIRNPVLVLNSKKQSKEQFWGNYTGHSPEFLKWHIATSACERCTGR